MGRTIFDMGKNTSKLFANAFQFGSLAPDPNTVRCPHCVLGTLPNVGGLSVRTNPDGSTDYEYTSAICTACNGTGRLKKCPTCGGSGGSGQ